MESLAYLHLALAYETSEPSEAGIQLEQMGKKGLDAEISNRSLSISSLPGILLIQTWAPSFKLHLLTRVKSIALLLFLLLSSPVGASLCRCRYVCDFQSSNGLVVNRKVGRHTRKYLKKSLRHRAYRKTNKGKVSHTSTLKLGSKGEKVVELKQRLESLGYSTADAADSDNVFNPKTQEAVKEFQKERNLQPDGVVGAKTNKALEAYWPSSMSARALFNRGLKHSEFSEALQDYNEAIKRDKNIAEAYYRRGMLYAYDDLAMGIDRDINKASNDFSEAVKINPDYVEAYLERGIIHNEKKDWKSAIDDWTQALLIEPDNIEAYYRRAKAKEQLKNTESAINDYIEVITRKLKSEQDTLLKAQVEEAIYNFKKRKVDGKLMLALLRGIATANVSDIFYREEYESQTGEYSVDVGDKEKAYNIGIEGLEDEINKNKSFEGETYQKLLLYYKELNQYQSKSDDPLRKQEAYFSPSPFASAYYYQGLLLKGNDTQAKKAFDETIEREPNFTKAYYLRGIIRSKQGDERGAISDFKKYLQGDPEMEEAKKNEGWEACLSQEIPKEYLETLDSSVPLEASAYLRRGKLRFLLRDYPGAKKDFQEVIKADPNLVADAYYQKGKVAAYEFYSSNDVDFKKAQEAKESFDEAIKRNPNISEAYFERGYLKYNIIIGNPASSTSIDEETKKNRDTMFNKKTDVAWIDDSQKDFKQAIKIDKSFAQAYYLMVVAERYKFRIQYEQQTEKDIVSIVEEVKEYDLSATEINNLTEAIRSDIYFYLDFIVDGRLTMKRAVCVDLGNSKQDNTTKSVSIIPFKSKKEEIYYTLALDNYRKKEYNQAIENISQAIKLNPDISDYYVIRGAAYYFYQHNNEYYKEAEKDFKASISLELNTIYSSSISHFLIGRIIENQDISQKHYKIALRSLPQADWLITPGAGGSQTQNTASSSSVRVPSKKCP